MTFIQQHLIILTIIPVALMLAFFAAIIKINWLTEHATLTKTLFELLRALGMIWLAICCCAAQQWWTLIPLVGFGILSGSYFRINNNPKPTATIKRSDQ